MNVEHDLLLLTTDLLRVAISNISYTRGLFPEKYFDDESIPGFGMKTKKLKPMNAESRGLIDAINKGVYDGLRRKYLKTLVFCTLERVNGPIIEEFSFSIDYSKSGTQDVTLVINHSGQTTFVGLLQSRYDITPNQMRSSACSMVSKLVQLMGTLDKIPYQRTIVMKLMYDDEVTPPDYAPPSLTACTEEEGHNAWTKVNSVLDPCEDDMQEERKSTGPDSVHDDKPYDADREVKPVENDAEEPVENEQQLARVKNWINSRHIDTMELTDVLSNFPDISQVPSQEIMDQLKKTGEDTYITNRDKTQSLRPQDVKTRPHVLGSTTRKPKIDLEGDTQRNVRPRNVHTKKIICHFFAKGIPCKMGSTCPYSHHAGEKDRASSSGVVDESEHLISIPERSNVTHVLPPKVEKNLRANQRANIGADLAKKYLGDNRYNFLKQTKPQDALKLFDDGVYAYVYWKTRQVNKSFKLDRQTGRKHRDALGPIRDQRKHCLCWTYVVSDMVSASLKLHGHEDEYIPLCPRYLMQNVNKQAYTRCIEPGVVHRCYSNNLESALAYVQKFGIPREEVENKTFKCWEERILSKEDKLYQIKGIFKYQTLDEALIRLRTHPVCATLLCFDNWQDSKIYCGPYKEGSTLQSLHGVIMMDCIVMEGKTVIVCKSSNGNLVGMDKDVGYIYVSTEVRLLMASKQWTEDNEDDKLCHVKPQYLLRDFFSIDMDDYHKQEPDKETEKVDQEKFKVDIDMYYYLTPPVLEGRLLKKENPGRKRHGKDHKVSLMVKVFDCWSMLCACPIEIKELIEKNFHGHFVAEGLDQTHGWFYPALFRKLGFRNLICNGLVLAEDGRKMSKKLQPLSEVIADAVRLYLINSLAVRAGPVRFRKGGVLTVNARRLVEIEGCGSFVPIDQETLQSSSFLEQCLVHFCRQEMDGYQLHTVVSYLLKFLDNLTNRFNRKGLKDGTGEDDCHTAALSALYNVLRTYCKVFTPFFTKTLYQNLRKACEGSEESIHYCSFAEVEGRKGDQRIGQSVIREAIAELWNDISGKLREHVLEDLRSLIRCNDSLKYASPKAEPDFSVLGNSMELVVAKEVKEMSPQDILRFEEVGETLSQATTDIKICLGSQMV